MCLAAGLAFLWIRAKFYETFLILHIALVILTLVGTWYHLIPHFGFTFGYQTWLYIAFAFWVFDRVVRVARVLFYMGSSKAVVEPIPGCDIMHVTVHPRTALGFGPGQHSFLFFPYIGVGKFWESHPFSVAAWRSKGQRNTLTLTTSASEPTTEKTTGADIEITATAGSSLSSRSRSREHATPLLNPGFDDRPSIHFLMRAHSGLTRKLQKELFGKDHRPVELDVYSEGPYAGHRATLQPLQNAETIVCLVGGIGITNALGYIQEYTSGQLQGGESQRKSRGLMRKAKRFVLLWSAKEQGLINFVKEKFLAFDDNFEGIEHSFWCTGPSTNAVVHDSDASDSEAQKNAHGGLSPSAVVTAGRMDIRKELRSYMEKSHQTTVLVCGPCQMIDEATKEVVDCIGEGYRVDIVEEAFAW